MGPIHAQALGVEPSVIEHQIALDLLDALPGQARRQRPVIGPLNRRVAQAAQVQIAHQACALLAAITQQLRRKPILRAQHIHGRRRGQQFHAGSRH